MPTLSRFMSWWGQGLRYSLPGIVRDFVFPLHHPVYLKLQNDKVRVFSQDKRVEDQVFPLSAKNISSDIRDCSTKWQELNLEQVALLPANYVIRRTIDLPVSQIENLLSQLQENMTDYTPFRVEEVYFDYKVKGINTESEKVLVDLAVIPKHLLQQEKDRLSALGLAVNRYGFAMLDSDRTASLPLIETEFFNFLSEKSQQKQDLPAGKVLLASIVLLLAAGSFYLQQKQSYEDALLQATSDQLAAVQREALAVKKLQDDIQSQQDRSRFLITQKASSYSVSDLLLAVSNTLPDDTWVIDARVNKKQLTLSGFSNDASRLIGLLENDKHFSNIRFTSPVANDARLKRERFNLALEINKRPLPEFTATGQADTGITDAAGLADKKGDAK